MLSCDTCGKELGDMWIHRHKPGLDKYACSRYCVTQQWIAEKRAKQAKEAGN